MRASPCTQSQMQMGRDRRGEWLMKVASPGFEQCCH